MRLKGKGDKGDDSFIDGILGDLLAKLQEETSQLKRHEITEELVTELTDLDINKNQNDEELLCSVARAFVKCIGEDLKSEKVFPDVPNQENLTDSVRNPLFVVLQAVYGCSNSKEDQANKSVLIRFLAEMHPFLPSLGKQMTAKLTELLK